MAGSDLDDSRKAAAALQRPGRAALIKPRTTRAFLHMPTRTTVTATIQPGSVGALRRPTRLHAAWAI